MSLFHKEYKQTKQKCLHNDGIFTFLNYLKDLATSCLVGILKYS